MLFNFNRVPNGLTKGVKENMGTNTIGRQNWTLTIIRDFKSSLDEEIEWEKFGYGRTASEELEDKERISLISHQGLVSSCLQERI